MSPTATRIATVCVLTAALAGATAHLACDPSTGLGGRPDSPGKVREWWTSSGIDEYGNTDSLAAVDVPGRGVQVFATAKEGNRLDVFDGATGQFVRSIGATGTSPGQFRRPNGVLALHPPAGSGLTEPLLLVVERDNARVQVLTAGQGRTVGLFGADVLHRPYGLDVSRTVDGVFLYVTDLDVPPSEAVKLFQLSFADGRVDGTLVRTFGEPRGPGQLREYESIAVDDAHDRVLLAEEAEGDRCIKVYTREGRFTGMLAGAGMFGDDVEGLAIYDAGDGEGLVLATDQMKHMTVWHVFDRRTLDWVVSFTGEPTVANTDGICLYPRPVGEQVQGALFVVHDDAEVRSYPLADILRRVKRARR